MIQLASDVIDNGTKIETAANCRRKRPSSLVPARSFRATRCMPLLDIARYYRSTITTWVWEYSLEIRKEIVRKEATVILIMQHSRLLRPLPAEFIRPSFLSKIFSCNIYTRYKISLLRTRKHPSRRKMIKKLRFLYYLTLSQRAPYCLSIITYTFNYFRHEFCNATLKVFPACARKIFSR